MAKIQRVWPYQPEFKMIPWDRANAAWGHHTIKAKDSDGNDVILPALGFVGISKDFWHFQVTGDSEDKRIPR